MNFPLSAFFKNLRTVRSHRAMMLSGRRELTDASSYLTQYSERFYSLLRRRAITMRYLCGLALRQLSYLRAYCSSLSARLKRLAARGGHMTAGSTPPDLLYIYLHFNTFLLEVALCNTHTNTYVAYNLLMEINRRSDHNNYYCKNKMNAWDRYLLNISFN